MARTQAVETLVLLGGKPDKNTRFGAGPKHGLDEWKAIKPTSPN